MKPNELRQAYLDFFAERGHSVIPSSSLVPENDPTTLFTTCGMQPLVPNLLGEKHPKGTRLVDSQKSFRADDIEEVGDNRHTTFFEMLGNWSLGDYFKEDQLTWLFTFLTELVGLDPNKLYVTVFSGSPESGISADTESVKQWKQLFNSKGVEAKDVELLTEEQGAEKGMQGGRIFYYNAKKNWWSRSGVPENMPAGEPGGPDSEIFYEFESVEHDPKYGKQCHPNCDCGRFLEIGNSVFMQFKKEADGSLTELPNKNVDFGGGFERILAAANDNPDVFTTELFQPLVTLVEETSDKKYSDTEHQASIRVVVDHLRAALFLIADGVEPNNKAQGYFLRRLIRRSVVKLKKLEIEDLNHFVEDFTRATTELYQNVYFTQITVEELSTVINKELTRFEKTLAKGLKIFEKTPEITGKVAFDLLQTYGFPWELTLELAAERNEKIDKLEFEKEFKKHQDLSRNSSKGMFKGGLADQSEATTKLHTATHLLHAALRNHLGTHVRQEGSHITADRLRFDFAHDKPLSDKEITAIEDEINQQIQAGLSVIKTIEDKNEAIESGAMSFFREKYPDKVSVYTIGKGENFYSKELCGGPHVENTADIGGIEIFKQQSIGAGKRRVYARLKK